MSQVGFLQKIKLFLGTKQIDPLPVSRAEALYHTILQASRNPVLYGQYGVEDSIDGRFDCLCLFQSLVMRRLTGRQEQLGKLSQDLFDAMFADMDMTLREMGVGDMGVGKRVKFMSEAYMGRLAAYDNALNQDDNQVLEQAIQRNLFRDGEVEGLVAELTKEVREITKRLDDVKDDDFLENDMHLSLFQVASLTSDS